MYKKAIKEKDSKVWLKNKQNLRTQKLYGGCKVYSPNGNLMFLCLEKRALWYLNKLDDVTGKPLAVKINHINPFINFLMKILSIKPKNLIVKFQFEPKGEGSVDKYSLGKKENRCVVTGDRDIKQLTKHHITPYCYRAFMPIDYKDANSHDVVPITREKHYEYEMHADKLKNILAKKYDAPIEGKRDIDHKLFYALKSARALRSGADKMPSYTVSIHKETIRKYTGKKNVTQKIIDELCSINFDKATNLKSHGEIVMQKVILGGKDSIQEFVEMWRQHFLDTANPRYMPKYWSVKRPASRIDIIKLSN